MLRIEKMEKSFGNLKAVDGISLNIKEGEIYGLLGPNGAGKSTTIKVLAGLLKKDHGKVELLGYDLDKELNKIKAVIGVVPQEIAIYPDLTAFENVKFFASLYGLRGKDLEKSSLEALQFVGLIDKAKKLPKTFSGGMKRRLNIACAIAHKPQLLIMDEPTVGIDPQSRNHILNSVRKLNEMGSTVIYTTHYMEEVEAICSRIGIIDHGKLIAEGTLDELQSILSDRNRIEVEVDLGTEINRNKLQEITGVIDVNYQEGKVVVETLKESDCIGEVTNFFVKNEIPIRQIGMTKTSLETIFLSLTGRSLRD